MYAQTIESTSRLVIRQWGEEDAEPFSRMTSKPDVMRYIGFGKLYDLDIAKEVIARRMKMDSELGYCMWALESKETGELIGHCGIQPLGDTGETEIGWLLDRQFWGQGLATEAARTVLDVAVNRFGFRRIVAITHPDNRASSRIMEKLGMRYEKTIEWRGMEGILMYAIEFKG